MHILEPRSMALAGAAALAALAACAPGARSTTREATPPPAAVRCEHESGSCALTHPAPSGAPCDCSTPFGMATGHAR